MQKQLRGLNNRVEYIETKQNKERNKEQNKTKTKTKINKRKQSRLVTNDTFPLAACSRSVSAMSLKLSTVKPNSRSWRISSVYMR